jgi:hypothetical protein
VDFGAGLDEVTGACEGERTTGGPAAEVVGANGLTTPDFVTEAGDHGSRRAV